MPGNGLTLAIRVGGEIKVISVLQRLDDGVDVFLRLGFDLPIHGEVIFRSDGAVLTRQIANVTNGGQHGVGAAQILIDGLGLGRGFNNDQIS